MPFRKRFLPVCLTLCLAALAWWLLSGYVPMIPAKNAPAVSTLFDGARALQILDALTHQFKGRVVGSAQGYAAGDYIAGRFLAYGLQVETQDFREAGAFPPKGAERGWFAGRNVLGTLPGKEPGSIVVTAHRDCIRQAPEGAYDNGSGTAIMMELARAIASGGPHRYTYAFAAIDGEEVGLAGARALMNKRPAALQDIRLMVNLDMIGHKQSRQLGVAHTQYLSQEARALVASHFPIPQYSLFQFPIGRGTDAQLFALRGLPTLDVREILPMFAKIEYHGPADTYAQVSANSMQQAGQEVERLLLQGDAMGAFTRSEGPAFFNGSGVLPRWRYLLGGACVFVVLLVPMLFRFRAALHAGAPLVMLVLLMLLTGVLTALSGLWAGSAAFVLLPGLCTIAFLVLQIVAVRRTRKSASRTGILLTAAAPAFLFAGTWLLTGLWPLGIWTAAIAYVPAVLVTWKAGWHWRLLDVAVILPGMLLTWLIALAAWISAPAHAFPPGELAVFASVYFAAALAGIWGIFGRRPHRLVVSAPSAADPAVS